MFSICIEVEQRSPRAVAQSAGRRHPNPAGTCQKRLSGAGGGRRARGVPPENGSQQTAAPPAKRANSAARSASCLGSKAAEKNHFFQREQLFSCTVLGELHVISVKCKILHVTLLARLTCIFTFVVQSELLTGAFETTSVESSDFFSHVKHI